MATCLWGCPNWLVGLVVTISSTLQSLLFVMGAQGHVGASGLSFVLFFLQLDMVFFLAFRIIKGMHPLHNWYSGYMLP